MGYRFRKRISDFRSLVEDCEFFYVSATEMRSIVTGCSSVISRNRMFVTNKLRKKGGSKT